MKLSELKDGYILTYRSGGKRIIIDLGLYAYPGLIKVDIDLMQYFNQDLTCRDYGSDHCDIIKVSYMGETLWERVEYVSFIEAVEHGELIKHIEWDNHHTVDNAFIIMSRGDYAFKVGAVKNNEWIIVKRKS